MTYKCPELQVEINITNCLINPCAFISYKQILLSSKPNFSYSFSPSFLSPPVHPFGFVLMKPWSFWKQCVILLIPPFSMLQHYISNHTLLFPPPTIHAFFLYLSCLQLNLFKLYYFTHRPLK